MRLGLDTYIKINSKKTCIQKGLNYMFKYDIRYKFNNQHDSGTSMTT